MKIPLKDCPNSPNCVSSLASRQRQQIPPLEYNGPAADFLRRVVDTLSSLPRVQILEQHPNYIHAVFTSKFFRFADDVEFWIDESRHMLHFRSASRLGYYDFGANRRRLLHLRRLLDS